MSKIISTIIFILGAATFSFAQTAGAVTANVAQLRGTPDAKAVVIATVKKDQKFEIITNRGIWYLVQTPKYVGWIDGSVISFDNDPSSQTVDNPKFKEKFNRSGDPNGRFDNSSNGPGPGTGVGSGPGTGQGNGLGSGQGNGAGSGSGADEGYARPPQTPKPTQGIKIISKPRAAYTDAAREANTQGIVVLRITFLASGQIGSVSPIKGLPHGLTEQAIAAARRIVFEPAKQNGVAVTTTRVMEFPFSIY